MPYPTQQVFVLDEAIRINITILKRDGFIQPGHRTEGTLSWRNDSVNISAAVEMKKEYGWMVIAYNVNGELQQYQVQIISRLSNLDNGSLIWLFVCPFTGHISRKLYFDGKRFIHRHGIKSMYRIQTKSKCARDSDQLFDYFLGPNDVNSQMQKKHLKKNYKGGLTKKYAALLKWKQRIDCITAAHVETLLTTGNFPGGIGKRG